MRFRTLVKRERDEPFLEPFTTGKRSLSIASMDGTGSATLGFEGIRRVKSAGGVGARSDADTMGEIGSTSSNKSDTSMEGSDEVFLSKMSD
ncbi:MAG: hypothetical protein ACOYK9_03185 [Chlamydiia bacterium]